MKLTKYANVFDANATTLGVTLNLKSFQTPNLDFWYSMWKLEKLFVVGRRSIIFCSHLEKNVLNI